MKTLIGLLGMILSIIGVVALISKEWLAAGSLLSSGFVLLAMCKHLDNQDIIIKSLDRISDPGQFFADKYFPRIIEVYTDNNPELKDKTFSATPPSRLDDGSFTSVLTVGNKKQYRAVFKYEGNPEDIHNWSITKFGPREG